ncbi:MAG: hypothetical protein ACXQTS_07795 [Candidatus Methanospirareceae archaeon]
MTKKKAFKIVLEQLRELCYRQRMRYDISAQQIAALVGLCELILFFFVLAITILGQQLVGMVICSMIMGSLVTNIVWLVLMKREMWRVEN